MYLPYTIAIGIAGLNGHGRFFSKQERSELSLLGKGAGSSKGLSILALFCLHNTKWWWQQCHMSLRVKGYAWSGGGCQTDTGRPDSRDEGGDGEHGALWTPAMVTSDEWVWVPGSIWGSETTQPLQGLG